MRAQFFLLTSAPPPKVPMVFVSSRWSTLLRWKARGLRGKHGKESQISPASESAGVVMNMVVIPRPALSSMFLSPF